MTMMLNFLVAARVLWCRTFLIPCGDFVFVGLVKNLGILERLHKSM